MLFITALLCGVLSTANNTSPANQTVRWFVPANGVLDPVNIPVNGSVTFSWTSTHDLWQIPSSSCPSTFANGSGITQMAARSNGGSRTVNFTSPGRYYYACSVEDHCAEGQHVTVTVGSPAPAPAPTSRYGSGYGGSANCGGNSTSGSGYGGSSGSGSNYAGAPGTSAYGGGSGSNSTGSNSTSTPSRSGSSSYGGGGAGYAGGSSENYGR